MSDLDFEKIAKDAGVPLVDGKLTGLKRSFCFFPKEDRGKQAIGKVISGTIEGTQRTVNDTIVLFVSTSNAITGETIVLHYFHENSLEVQFSNVPAAGWYVQATDNYDPTKISYYSGRLKFL